VLTLSWNGDAFPFCSAPVTAFAHTTVWPLGITFGGLTEVFFASSLRWNNCSKVNTEKT